MPRPPIAAHSDRTPDRPQLTLDQVALLLSAAEAGAAAENLLWFIEARTDRTEVTA